MGVATAWLIRDEIGGNGPLAVDTTKQKFDVILDAFEPTSALLGARWKLRLGGPSLRSKRCCVSPSARLQVGEQVENLFFAQDVQQTRWHR